MEYNKFIAYGIARGAIRVTFAHKTEKAAAKEFFIEFPSAEYCTVRRVAALINGDTVNDPEFQVRRFEKKHLTK